MTTQRELVSQILQKVSLKTMFKIAQFVIIMAIVSMTVDYSSLKGGEAGK